MKLQYIGKKKQFVVTIPVGAIKRNQTGKITFKEGQTHEFSDQEGQLLMDLNAQEVTLQDMHPSLFFEKDRLTKITDTLYKVQHNFSIVKEEKQPEKTHETEEKEEIDEETGLLTDPIKKRGRPKKQ